MRLKTLAAGLSSLALIATPALAAANPAAPLSVSSNVRASSSEGESRFNAPGSIVGLILFAAVIAGGIILVTSDDDGPDSP